MKNNFCVLPWMHLTINPNHKYKLCCHSDTPLPLDAKEISMEDMMTSRIMEDIRNQFRQGNWPAQCNICKLTEEKGMRSQRQAYNETFKVFVDNFVDEPRVKSVDLKFSNECNLECRMCSTTSSNKINETIKFLGSELPDHWKGMSLWEDDKARLPVDIDNQLKLLDLYKFKTTGGEPTMQTRWLNLVNHFVESGKCKNIVLDFTTNGTKFNDALLDKIVKFKKVKIRISVDGINDTYDYIRFPYKWKILEKRIKNLVKFCAAHEHINIGVSCLGQVYNVFNVGELWQWCNDLKLQYYRHNPHQFSFFIDYFVRPLDSEYNIKFLPYDLVSAAFAKFEKEITREKSLVNDFRKYLDICKETDESKLSALKRSTSILDKYRQQTYKVLHKDIVRYINGQH